MSVSTDWAVTIGEDVPTVTVTIDPEPEIVTTLTEPETPMTAGLASQWVAITREEFDLLDPPDPGTIYLVFGPGEPGGGGPLRVSLADTVDDLPDTAEPGEVWLVSERYLYRWEED